MKPDTRDKRSNGGIKMAIIQREEAIKNYYKNPNICEYCKKEIRVKDDEKVAYVRRKRFCNISCSKLFCNMSKSKNVQCLSCKEEIKREKSVVSGKYSIKEYCDKCRPEIKAKSRGADTYIANLTRGQVMKKYSKYYIGRNIIRKHAVAVFNKSKKQKKCIVCGYDRHIDVAHLKGVSEFAEGSLVSEINHMDNLIGLCPTHHWEYDNGFLKF